MLTEFMERCNQVFGRRNITCPECDNWLKILLMNGSLSVDDITEYKLILVTTA